MKNTTSRATRSIVVQEERRKDILRVEIWSVLFIIFSQGEQDICLLLVCMCSGLTTTIAADWLYVYSYRYIEEKWNSFGVRAPSIAAHRMASKRKKRNREQELFVYVRGDGEEGVGVKWSVVSSFNITSSSTGKDNSWYHDLKLTTTICAPQWWRSSEVVFFCFLFLLFFFWR